MNTRRFITSIAVLIVAAFWAIFLLDFYATIFAIVILLVTPFIILLVIGIHGILDALGVGTQSDGGSSRGGGRVGVLGMTVLKMLSQGKSQQEIAAATSVSVVVVGVKMDALRKAGYLQENGLSEKGFNLVSESS